MPGSITTSGSGSGSNPAAVRTGIDSSIDIEQIKLDLSALREEFDPIALLTAIAEVKTAIQNLVFPIATRVPQLRPAAISAPNAAVSTPAIPAPGVGKHLVVQLMGWYNKIPTGGVLRVVGTDGEIYTDIAITSAGAGFMQKAALPENVGCTISLTAGGADVVGSLNYAIAIEDEVN